MAYQFRYQQRNFSTADGKLIFWPGNMLNRKPTYDTLYVLAGTSLSEEERDILFSHIQDGSTILRKERTRFLRAAKEQLALERYDLDTRCLRYIVWETTDGQWETRGRRIGSARRWTAQRCGNPLGTDPQHPGSPTREAAIEWVIAQEEM